MINQILNGVKENVSELKASIGEVLATITPEMCCQAMLSVQRCFQVCVQSGSQHFEHLCEVVNLRFMQKGTPTCSFTGALCALMLAAEIWVYYHVRNDCRYDLNPLGGGGVCERLLSSSRKEMFFMKICYRL